MSINYAIQPPRCFLVQPQVRVKRFLSSPPLLFSFFLFLCFSCTPDSIALSDLFNRARPAYDVVHAAGSDEKINNKKSGQLHEGRSNDGGLKPSNGSFLSGTGRKFSHTS